jgi:hypothetical protein
MHGRWLGNTRVVVEIDKSNEAGENVGKLVFGPPSSGRGGGGTAASASHTSTRLGSTVCLSLTPAPYFIFAFKLVRHFLISLSKNPFITLP